MNPRLRRYAWLIAAALASLGCKKKEAPTSTEKEPVTDPNRCTSSTNEVECPAGKFCLVLAKDRAGKDPAVDKIWGTCVPKRKLGEECENSEDCADPNASCEGDDEADAKSVCTLDE